MEALGLGLGLDRPTTMRKELEEARGGLKIDKRRKLSDILDAHPQGSIYEVMV